MNEYGFTDDDLAYMRAVQEGHMMDNCIIRHETASYNSMHEEILSYTEDPESICGLDMRAGVERHGQDNVYLQYDATVRLPISTVIDAKDQIKITKRFGEIITPIIFEIVGIIQRGPSGIRLLLRRIEL